MVRRVRASDDGVVVGVRAAAFDRLEACAAVLDGDGIIVDTNDAWRLFTRLNDGDVNTTGPGMDYLRVCDRAASMGWPERRRRRGLREILNGERQRMDFEYPCPSATEDRWCLLQASAAPVANGAGAVLLHVDITDRKLAADGWLRSSVTMR